MTAATARVRAGVGLFATDDLALLEVRGADRVRWLDGMLTQNVKALAARGEGAGCHALLLTHRGAIVADLAVAVLGDALVLACARTASAPTRAALEKMIIADDVALSDRGDAFAALALEGGRAADVLGAALGAAAVPPAGDWCAAAIAGAPVRIGAFGRSGERAFQLFVPPAACEAVRRALESAAAERGIDCVAGDAALLEVLRVEAGIPLQGAELDADVLPPEARLEGAIANNKGCYVGQEIVARLRSRGQVNHLLVGLRFEGAPPPAVGSALGVAGRATGEITSVADSPSEGPIALAFVRREHAEPGTVVDVAGGATARVAALPFVVPSAGAAAGDPTA